MRAVMLEVDEAVLARRRTMGIDRWDEMWEGVLHMAPAPTNEHQRIQDELVAFLIPHLRSSGQGTLRSGVNVFGRVDDYRIPDLSFIAAGRESIIAEDGLRGGPDAVFEIRSPRDETYDKLPFYARIGVREVVVIDRTSKRPEVLRLVDGTYVPAPIDVDGWVDADVMGIRLRATDGRLELLHRPSGSSTTI